MPTLAELNAKVDELQTALDEEQQQVADDRTAKEATIATLTQTVADLQAIIDAGNPANEAEIQAIMDKLNGAITDLKGTIEP
jgi:uncharacterized coiled-coil protein SlyX